MQNNEKIGLVVTTYNTESWFKKLYETIPFHKLDECVIINGGNLYTDVYKKHTAWIQHNINVGAVQSRIDGIHYLLGRKCEHIFIIEDDMLLKNENVFQRYIEASKATGLKYLCFCSNAMGSGEPGMRTPARTVDYKKDKISFYREMNNEFTYHHASVFKDIGVYDTNFKHLWDVEFVYRVLISEKYGCGFRYFPDVFDSDEYVANLPESINNSRTNVNNKRNQELPPYFQMFQQKHGFHIPHIPIWPEQQFLQKLKELHSRR